jgi:small-conductance mechanosensitive channel
VPNSQFISEPVTNWSRPDVLTAYVLTFHVAPASDPERVRRILLDAAAAYGDVLGEPGPEVEFVEMGPSLRFQVPVWSSAHLNTAGKLKSDLNFEVWRRLKAEGIAPPAAALAVTVSAAAR